MLRSGEGHPRIPTSRSIWKCAAIAMFALLVAATALAQHGADSPEAVVAAMKKAAGANDVPALIHLIAPSQLNVLALQTDMAADMLAATTEGEAGKDLTGKLEALRKKYGVVMKEAETPLHVDENTTEEEMDAHIEKRARELYGTVDVAGYTAELTALLLTTPQMAGQSLMPPGEVGKITTNGDHASARIGDQDIGLVRENGRWYLARPGS